MLRFIAKKNNFPVHAQHLILKQHQKEVDICKTFMSVLQEMPAALNISKGETDGPLEIEMLKNLQIKSPVDNQNISFNLYIASKTHDGSPTDIVSAMLQSSGEWELHTISRLITFLERFRHEKRLERSEVVFLDIGANLGSISIPIAHAGFQVMAFEGYSTNQKMLQMSFCANKNILDHFTFYPVALGEKSDTCRLFSPTGNTLNGHIFCGDSEPEDPDMRYRFSMDIVPLDSIVETWPTNTKSGVAAMKIDVEGFESTILKGGSRLFDSHPPEIVISEVNSYNLLSKNSSPSELMERFQSYGYRMRLDLDSEEVNIDQVNTVLHSQNEIGLFFTRY